MSLLIDLNPKEKERYKIPLVLVSDIVGNEVVFAKLAAAYDLLDPFRPIYGLRSPFYEAKITKPKTVAELAELYIKILEQQNINDNYLLCGYSFGGIIAAEIAKQLEAKGKKIFFLGCIDTDLDTHLANLSQAEAAKQLLKIVGLLNKLLGLQVNFMDTVSLTTTWAQQDKTTQIKELFALLKVACAELCQASQLEKNLKIIEVVEENLLLSSQYKPDFPLTEVILFAAQHESHQSPNLGWDRAEEVRVEPVKADHFNILFNDSAIAKLSASLALHVNTSEINKLSINLYQRFKLMHLFAKENINYLRASISTDLHKRSDDLEKQLAPLDQKLEDLDTVAIAWHAKFAEFIDELLEINQDQNDKQERLALKSMTNTL